MSNGKSYLSNGKQKDKALRLIVLSILLRLLQLSLSTIKPLSSLTKNVEDIYDGKSFLVKKWDIAHTLGQVKCFKDPWLLMNRR